MTTSIIITMNKGMESQQDASEESCELCGKQHHHMFTSAVEI